MPGQAPAQADSGHPEKHKSKGHPSIRAQAKRDRQAAATAPSGPKDGRPAPYGADAAGVDRTVVKAVLSSPMTVPWYVEAGPTREGPRADRRRPSIPTHLQATIVAALPQVVPSEVADWHVGRGRCHTAAKKEKRRLAREEGRKNGVGDGEGRAGAVKGKEASMAGQPDASRRPTDTMQAQRPDPTPPEVLAHLVVGLNETIKTLERQITRIRIELGLMAEALVLKQAGGRGHVQGAGTVGNAGAGVTQNQLGHPRGAEGDLLPTAPAEAEDGSMSDEEDEVDDPELDSSKGGPVVGSEKPGAQSTHRRDLGSSSRPAVDMQYILIPHLSLNPISLGTPLLRYAATYNALVYQHKHLFRLAQTRLSADERAKAGVGDKDKNKEKEEVSVVPLGKKEAELSLLVGLRRVACLGVGRGHPALAVLTDLVPKSVLRPPRLGLTVAMPLESVLATYGLSPVPMGAPAAPAAVPGEPAPQGPVHPTAPATVSAPAPAPAPSGRDATRPPTPLPLLTSAPHYAPLHIKGITTTVPADGNARKRKRLEEVRAKREEKKGRRREEREREGREAGKGLGQVEGRGGKGGKRARRGP